MNPYSDPDYEPEFGCDETCIKYDAGVEIYRCKHYGKCPATAGAVDGD